MVGRRCGHELFLSNENDELLAFRFESKHVSAKPTDIDFFRMKY